MAKISLDKLFASQEILTFVEKLNTELAKTGETIDKISSKKPLKATGEQTKELNKEIEKQNTLSKEQIKINKEAAKRALQVQKLRERKLKQDKKLTKEAIRLNEVRKQEKAELTKVTRAEIVLQKAQKRGIKTIQDMKKQISALNAQREREDLTTKRGQKNYKRLTSEISKAEKQVKKYDAAIGRSQRNVGNYAGSLRNLAGVFGIAFGARIVVDFIKEGAQLAGVLDGVKKAFEGLNEPNLLSNLKTATRGTVTDLKLMQAAVKAKNFKIPLEQLATYFEFATKRSAETGESVDFLVESIINGIGRKSPLILDNLGISAAQLSAEFKKTGDFGAAAGKIIEQELSKMGDVTETSAQKLARLSATFENIQTNLGNALLPVIDKVITFISKLINVLSGPNSLSSAFGRLGSLIKEQFNAFKKLIAAFSGVNAESITLKDVIDKLGRAVSFLLGPVRLLIKWNTALINTFTGLVKAGRNFLEWLNILDEQQEKVTETTEENTFSWIAKKEVLDQINKTTEENTAITNKNTKATKEHTKSLITEEEQIKAVTDALDEFSKEIAAGEDDIVGVINKNAKASFDVAVLDFQKAQALEKQQFALYNGNAELRTQFAKEQADELLEFKKTKELEYLTFLKAARLEANQVDQAALDTQIEQVKATLIELKTEVSKPLGEDDDDEGGIIDRGLGLLWEKLGLTPEKGAMAAQALTDTYNVIKGILDQALQDQINRYDKSIQLSDTKIAKLEDELEEQLNRDQKGAASTTKTTQQAIADERKKNNELIAARAKAAKRQKQIAITEATINTALSVTNALSQKPFILGLILAISAAAKGIAEIRKIKSANFAKGTEFVELNGNKPGIDTVNANLTAGERVVPVKENAQMKGFPNKLLPAAVNHYMSLDPYSLNSKNLNFTDTSKLESGVYETNRLLKDIKDKPIKHYHNGVLVKAEYSSHVEIYI